MTDQNAPAAESELTPEEFEAAMNQPLFGGPVMMDLDGALACNSRRSISMMRRTAKLSSLSRKCTCTGTTISQR
jgi:hypothetical protein